jgi:hypothetical protein
MDKTSLDSAQSITVFRTFITSGEGILSLVRFLWYPKYHHRKLMILNFH